MASHYRIAAPTATLGCPEVKLGLIGLGGDQHLLNNNDAEMLHGGLAKVGMKFIRTPNYAARGTRLAHPLKGAYIKPEIMLMKVLLPQPLGPNTEMNFPIGRSIEKSS